MSQASSDHQKRVRDRLLASIDLIDAARACAILRIETAAPEGILEDLVSGNAVISLPLDGRTLFPLFQFDLEKGQVFVVVRDILKIRPARISNFRLCYWMTRAHSDFGCAPADLFGKEDSAVRDAFKRDIEPVYHG